MSRFRTASLVLAITAATLLVFSSLGYAATTADRSADISVAGDQNAYVGYSTDDRTATTGEEIELVTVTNSFSDEIEITNIHITGGASDVSISATTGQQISPGNSASVAGTVQHCEPGETAIVGVSVEATGTDVQTEIDGTVQYREFHLECELQIDGVDFFGNGTAAVTPDGLELEADVLFREPGKRGNGTESGSSTYRVESITLDTTERVTSQVAQQGSPAGKLVGLHFPEIDATYINPPHNSDSERFPHPFGE